MLRRMSGISARISPFHQQVSLCLDTEYSDDEPCQIISEHRMRSPTPVPPPTDHAMDIVEESSASYSRDVLEMLRLSYGYSSPLVDIVGSVDDKWEKILLALGFVEDFQELSVLESEKHPIGVFFYLRLPGRQKSPLR